MLFSISLLLGLLLRGVCGAVEVPNSGFVLGNNDFVWVKEPEGGQRETIVSFGNLLSVETANKNSNGSYVLEMTNGMDFLILIYKERGGNLLDCEMARSDIERLSLFIYQYSNDHVTGLVSRQVEGEEVDPSLVDWEGSKSRCDQLQKQRREQQQLEENDSRSRSRRSIVYPGTTWCGMGNISTSNEETDGAHVETDKCCRKHDLCDYTIEAFTRKYGMINFRFYTISHCECDDRFRTCLRLSNNPVANQVGRLFFNILGMKCFIFEKETVCRERNWYGRCIRQGIQFKAVLRDSVPYYNND